MNFEEIKALMDAFSNSEIDRLSIENQDFKIKLTKHPSPSPHTLNHALNPQASFPINPTLPSPADSIKIEEPLRSSDSNDSQNTDFITSPMVGTFYRSPSPGAKPYIQVGDTVKKGQIVGIVEAMKIMNEIEAEYDCKIISIEVTDGQPVEFGSNLLKVEKI